MVLRCTRSSRGQVLNGQGSRLAFRPERQPVGVPHSDSVASSFPSQVVSDDALVHWLDQYNSSADTCTHAYWLVSGFFLCFSQLPLRCHAACGHCVAPTPGLGARAHAVLLPGGSCSRRARGRAPRCRRPAARCPLAVGAQMLLSVSSLTLSLLLSIRVFLYFFSFLSF